MKILIVEDDKDTLTLIHHYLKDTEFEVITCRRGDEALDMAIEEKPDLAIIDGLLPGIHGFELCKMIKEEKSLKKHPKVMIMSSVYKGIKYKGEVIDKFKADDYIIKPLKKPELLEKIDKLLK
jgi:DNA-binding response OmpR family regulator